MSLYDDFRDLRADLFAEFEAAAATLTRTTTGNRSAADRIQGITATTTTDIPAKAFLGSRRVRNEKGVYTVEQIARLDAEPRTGDRLTVGARSWEITTIEEINPDGSTPIFFVAGLK